MSLLDALILDIGLLLFFLPYIFLLTPRLQQIARGAAEAAALAERFSRQMVTR